ncbi:MAG: zinc ribbon domain-containing protein [Promethearchaeota archaeon]
MPFCTNCGNQIEGNLKFCPSCGESLEKTEIKGGVDDNFYVPIDFSEVREVIPIGEDIIYSALFSGLIQGPAGPVTQTQTFQSHILFTKNGIAFQEPKAHLMASRYIPWYQVEVLNVGLFMFKKGLTIYTFTMMPTMEDYVMRTWKFYFEFLPYVINEKTKRGYTKGLNRLAKIYYKIKKELGEEEYEFIKDNNDYEEFKKHFPSLKEAVLRVTPKWAKFLARKYIQEP